MPACSDVQPKSSRRRADVGPRSFAEVDEIVCRWTDGADVGMFIGTTRQKYQPAAGFEPPSRRRRHVYWDNTPVSRRWDSNPVSFECEVSALTTTPRSQQTTLVCFVGLCPFGLTRPFQSRKDDRMETLVFLASTLGPVHIESLVPLLLRDTYWKGRPHNGFI